MRHNNAVTNTHFHKDWANRVKTWFHQPAQKKRRAAKRATKASRLYPRPIGHLRPIVRCPTNRHNGRVRLGRGFTIQELRGAQWDLNQARSFGVSIDFRRRNASLNTLKTNINRLQLYRSKIVVLPKNWGLGGQLSAEKKEKIDKAIDSRKRRRIDAIASESADVTMSEPSAKKSVNRRLLHASDIPREKIVQHKQLLPITKVAFKPRTVLYKPELNKHNTYQILKRLRRKERFGRDDKPGTGRKFKNQVKN